MLGYVVRLFDSVRISGGVKASVLSDKSQPTHQFMDTARYSNKMGTYVPEEEI